MEFSYIERIVFGFCLGIIMGLGITTNEQTGRIEQELETLESSRLYELRTENVIGQETPEKFYEINGQRVYLEIDGQSVEQYFKK